MWLAVGDMLKTANIKQNILKTNVFHQVKSDSSLRNTIKY